LNIPFELHIALRYLLAKRKQAFISIISFISILGVTVGVMALVIALALMTGLQQEVRDRILGSTPHIYVWKQGGIEDYRAEAEQMRRLPRVVGAAPAILDQALAASADVRLPIQIKGIDPPMEQEVTDIKAAVQTGSLDDLTRRPEGEPAGILLGRDLAARLQVSVNDTVTVLTPQGSLSPAGFVPRFQRLRVVGTFSLGLYEFDSSFGYVSLDVASRLFGKPDVDLIQLRVDDIFEAAAVADAVVERLGPAYLTQDWQDMNRSLFYALSLEKIAISLTIGLIVVVAALQIVASLILLVMEKHRDIAILKTMGAGARSITAIFMLQGLIIGAVGTTVGAVAGWAVAMVADRYRLINIPLDVYQVSHVPFTVLPRDLAIVVATSVFVCFVATIYPSRQAARLDPVQALRYE
jgi:lipoprotein-releasing system permease protein